ncbi:hypothetical protein F4809DRAFT_642234 [Biscogniauxia mediterranea]|nr:hypothetical protein F4809DRAFT_642234 [Biscogniauxia mediterranea]
MTSPNPTEEGDPSGPRGSGSDVTATGQKTTPEKAADTTEPTHGASTPAGAAGPQKAPATNRPRAATMKTHPTLLGDFLLGRPSAARIAADREAARQAARQRRQSLELVKQEMRQAALLRVQAPGGVHDRVKKWQKANAEAMAKADPLAAPTEPSEVNIQVEEESVTEEDRVRIKMRQKRKPHPKGLAVEQKSAAGDEEHQTDMRSSSPPKKRVVSDTNWVKDQTKSSPKKQAPKPKPTESSGRPLPKDFLLRPTANPSVSKKIKDWASRVEIPDEPIKRPGSYARSAGGGSHSRVRSMPSVSDITSGGSETTQITVGPASSPKPKKPEDDGIRVRPQRLSTSPSKDDGIRVKPQPRSLPDDGIRVKPMPTSPVNAAAKGKARASPTQQDDGIRVKPQTTRVPDDGIRVRAIRQPSIKATPRAPVRQAPKVTVTRRTSARKEPSPPARTATVKDKAPETPKIPERTSTSARPGQKRSLKLRPKPAAGYTDTSTVTGTEITGTSATVTDVTSTEVTGTTGTTDSRVTGTGTYTTGSYMTSSYMTGTEVTGTKVTSSEETATRRTRTEVTEDISDSESWTSSESEVESERPSSAPEKSLADIPFGYSAFSELELPLRPGGRAVRRSKTTKHSGLKGATNVLRRALTEGKKILTEKAEPPKPVHNQPPSIENWLKDTVDPFVEGKPQSEKEPQRKSSEEEWVDEPSPKRPSPAPRRRSAEHKRTPSSAKKEDRHTEPKAAAKPKAEEPTTKQEVAIPLSPTLRRSRATRVSSSSLKSANKKGFKDVLREAFRGESTGHTPPPLEYSSYEEVRNIDEPHVDDYQERRRSSSTRRSSQHDDHSARRSPKHDDDYSDDDSSVTVEPVRAVPPPLYPKRRPPTNGFHELSTIVSDGGDAFSTLESEISSMVSDTTITHTTGLSRSTALSRKRSQNPGLKRRLTKHSDLVSVLSLPDNTATLRSSRSLRATRSVRRPTSHLDHATVEGLLQEFANDEDLYQRELKTVVDGVIPVLLKHLVYGDGSSAKDLFGPSCGNPKEDKMSKAVVNMGVFLEKLKNQHRRCPLSDVHRLPQWLESVQNIYESYLDVWRLGFQGIIVNLAPASPDDMDSLVNAMPRNEQGDVINEHGDRIDVAHLLKRPLVRVKWIAKFIQGYRTVTGTNQYEALASKWDALQLKARRRYKEEVARVVDDDAKYTDTSRVRDLRTMGPLDDVRIDRYRQVYAKDEFSLNLRHSNGQRIDCQVELIYRDNQFFKSDPGDLLIREAGSEGRSWLLFAPITGGHYSARRGDGRLQLVVMIRGYKDEWYELITLTTDSEEQVLDWLNILGSNPMPPELSTGVPLERQSSVLSPKTSTGDAPLGERRSLRQKSRTAPAPIKVADSEERPKTPSRYHRRNNSFSTTPTSSSPTSSNPSPRRTPTQDSYMKPRHGSPDAPLEDDYEDHSLPLREDLRPKPLTLRKASPNSTPFRQDGAPPPPIHRTLGSKKSPTLAPPPEKGHPTLKRRTSSPLKHEYHPSDISSESSFSTSESEEDDVSISDESSDDELEAADMPDTAPAISIKRETDLPTDSFISESVVSLTPSASASQAGMPAGASQHPDYLFKSLASISYWDNKHGCWKDLWPDVCSIVTTPGLIEAYPLRRSHMSSDDPRQDEERPLIALDLTPLVMLRNSTALDLEIRSPVLSYARLYSKVTKAETSFFRFRAPSFQECETLYMAAHRARMDNAKYKALEEETRVRAFGQHHAVETDDDGANQRRSWFGRKNSYRASARAPSQSAGSASHSSISATSFLKRILGGAGNSFNIEASSVDRPSRSGSRENSLYSSESPPRSPSVSAANSSRTMKMSLTTNNLKIRLHLLVSASKWEDHGNCYLEVTRPDRGTRQNLRKYQGMEKRIIVTSIPKKEKDTEKNGVVVKLDVVLGSRCFSRLGSRGILLNVWEEVKDESGEAGVAPKGGNSGGNVNKWCFQCASVMEASWIFGLVTQEVVIS